MTNLPTVRIDYSWLLSNQASEDLNKLHGDGTPLESYEYYTKVAEKYAKWWATDNDAILHGICELTGLSFYQNTIDVHVAPWFYAFSSPMVLGVRFKTKNELVNVLTHEIIHRLLTDNTTYGHSYDFIKLWQSMFGQDVSWNTLVHIPVHALMQELYLDVINRPDLLKHDKESLVKMGSTDYIAAWDYVDTHGHKEIMNKIRAHIKQTHQIL